MSDPVITSMHVSSLYVWQHEPRGYRFTEVGWSFQKGVGEPRFFAAWKGNGLYESADLGLAPRGTNHYYSVRNVSGTDYWRWYLDGIFKIERYVWNFRQGYTVVSSEHSAPDETNYSHFWSLKRRDSAGNWNYWTNLSLYEDNDPDYYLNKVSNTECYVQR
ncbi:MAG: hypothetical protein AB1330_12695 [Bacillota bacterium]